jgi:hypothetical protein
VIMPEIYVETKHMKIMQRRQLYALPVSASYLALTRISVLRV